LLCSAVSSSILAGCFFLFGEQFSRRAPSAFVTAAVAHEKQGIVPRRKRIASFCNGAQAQDDKLAGVFQSASAVWMLSLSGLGVFRCQTTLIGRKPKPPRRQPAAGGCVLRSPLQIRGAGPAVRCPLPCQTQKASARAPAFGAADSARRFDLGRLLDPAAGKRARRTKAGSGGLARLRLGTVSGNPALLPG
jgi:hypothetical protein